MTTRFRQASLDVSDSIPRRLYEEAKGGSGWNPSNLDFTQDARDWEQLDGDLRVPTLALSVLGESSSQHMMAQAAPMLVALEKFTPLDAQLCFSSILFEKARQTEFYDLLLSDVLHLVGDPKRFEQPQFLGFFDNRLPRAFDQLNSDPSPERLAEVLSLYSVIADGVVTASATQMFARLLERLDRMPTTRNALQVQHDYAQRHVSFAVYLLASLVDQEPGVWQIVDDTLQGSFELAVGTIREFFERFSNTVVSRAEAVTHAVEQFSLCYERVEKGRHDRPHTFRSSAVPVSRHAP